MARARAHHRPQGPTLVRQPRSIRDATSEIERARRRLQQAQAADAPRHARDTGPSVNAPVVEATIRDRRRASQMAAAQRRVAEVQPKTPHEQLVVNQEEILRRLSAIESMVSSMARIVEGLVGDEGESSDDAESPMVAAAAELDGDTGVDFGTFSGPNGPEADVPADDGEQADGEQDASDR